MNNNDAVNDLVQILRKTANTEKHHGYHILPERVEINVKDKESKSNPVFYEKERMDFIRSKISFLDKSVMDIGCNTGYFIFGALDDNASRVTGYEGKALCHEFVESAIKFYGEQKKFKFIKEYYGFSDVASEKHDVVILMNVLHHIGDDYGEKSMSINEAKANIIEQINNLSRTTSVLIYQMGFNWKGDVKECLFENGTKQEMINFIKEGTKNNWKVLAIGIAEKTNEKIIYQNLNSKNIHRDDSLGEFLNRPLFILQSIVNEP